MHASERPLPPWPGAALERLRTAAAGGVGLGALRAAARDGSAPVDAIAVVCFELAHGQPARLSHRSRTQLLRSAAQVERVTGDWAAAGEWLVDRISQHADVLTLGDEPEQAPAVATVTPGQRPASVGFYCFELRRTARAWRRSWRATRDERRGQR